VQALSNGGASAKEDADDFAAVGIQLVGLVDSFSEDRFESRTTRVKRIRMVLRSRRGSVERIR
jgi:hypothetical protein